jgi:hypothetical protein
VHQVCSRRHRLLHRARRRQAVPAQGLRQGISRRRHTPLHRARRGQAVPARGLPQGGSYRRHAALQGARWGQAVPAAGLLQVSRSSSRQHALHVVSAGHTAAARRCGGAATLNTRPATQLARTRGDPAAGGGLRINQFTAVGCICTSLYASTAMTHLTHPCGARGQGGCASFFLLAISAFHNF